MINEVNVKGWTFVNKEVDSLLVSPTGVEVVIESTAHMGGAFEGARFDIEDSNVVREFYEVGGREVLMLRLDLHHHKDKDGARIDTYVSVWGFVYADELEAAANVDPE